MKFYSRTFYRISLLSMLTLASPAFAEATLEPGEILCQYHYGFDKELEPTEWRKLDFSAQPSRQDGNQVWTARPDPLPNSPFASVVVSLTARAAQPGLIEISLAPVNPAVEVVDNNFFSGTRDDRGMVLTANLAENSESIPAITLADEAAGFPQGHLVLGMKCAQELRGLRSVWPKIRRKL